ncbi:hypothetical protein llap_11413 [Limosa lapponica baueri]|uniref:Uncharacterized protein n=1 Tax=Limosa lapponica baueri TaxID=1758121 RepID=A0A2I0TWW0_LIMLA|nr:hypothetical protein llap_11413 [Limosa lapponica baueri]
MGLSQSPSCTPFSTTESTALPSTSSMGFSPWWGLEKALEKTRNLPAVNAAPTPAVTDPVSHRVVSRTQIAIEILAEDNGLNSLDAECFQRRN